MCSITRTQSCRHEAPHSLIVELLISTHVTDPPIFQSSQLRSCKLCQNIAHMCDGQFIMRLL